LVDPILRPTKGRRYVPKFNRERDIPHQGHDVTLALDRPQLEGQGRPQGVAGGNHLRAREPRGLGELGEVEANEVRHEQEEAAAARLDPPGRQGEGAHIRHGFHGGPRPRGPFLVPATREGRKPFGLEHFPHRRRAERQPALREGLADLVHGVVPFAQGDDRVARGRLLGLRSGPAVGGDKEDRGSLAPKLMAHDAEGPRRIPEGAGGLVRRARVHEVGAQGLVGPLLGRLGLEEEAPALR
jgi:hypothetical protein